MSVLAIRIRQEIYHAQELVRVHGRPVLRQAWPALGLLLIIPGVFNAGVISNTSEKSQANAINMHVEYAPTAYLYKPTILSISIMNALRNKGEFSIRVEKKLLDDFAVTRIEPEPVSTNIGTREITYRFSDLGYRILTFTLMPKKLGTTAVTLQFGIDPPVAFSIKTLL